ncbi:uncharacterized protein [Blastocystis hominis]|uniref:Uncharacterized protein n=1 Tax=Blastocystis hominis TaxID=12968 RepID=D8M4Y7_BLAHO|nr:uncharacterized protein [Blastocystis hominis]CBK23126.2 unnamed protein product [Blastocystis hominis]|eukprot:XP_012897174.1 uncharacterized protein [Blastocystis hominis]
MTNSRISVCGAFVGCRPSAGRFLHVHKRAVSERLSLSVPYRRPCTPFIHSFIHSFIQNPIIQFIHSFIQNPIIQFIHSLTHSLICVEVWRHPCQHYRSPKQRSPASRAADRFSPLRPLRYLQCHRRDRRAPRLERSLQRVRLCSAFHPTRFHHRYHRSHPLSLYSPTERPPSSPRTRHRSLHSQRVPHRAELPFHRDSDRSEQQREVGVPQADRSARLSDPDRLLCSSGARLSESIPLHPHQIQHDRKRRRFRLVVHAGPHAH